MAYILKVYFALIRGICCVQDDQACTQQNAGAHYSTLPALLSVIFLPSLERTSGAEKRQLIRQEGAQVERWSA